MMLPRKSYFQKNGRIYHIIGHFNQKVINGVKRMTYAVYDGNRMVGLVFRMDTDWAYVRKFDIIFHAGTTRANTAEALVRSEG